MVTAKLQVVLNLPSQHKLCILQRFIVQQPVQFCPLLQDGRKISIDCTRVEDALDVTMAQRSELDYLIYNDPLSYADLILNGDPKEYLKNVVGGHGSEDLSFRD